ncbi:hypothetical protein AWV77_27165 [Pseudomonas palleroniana]|uniref:Uncharacterized protein n=1 Tax=Pseudomonas palleroniana TaxID=191390 RepID=A0A109FNB0_9PSED|nr:hypothetical protein AWV77_27165 [Pseudomonas palleroniana]
MILRRLESLFDQLYVVLRGCNAFCGFFLKTMEDINSGAKPNGVHPSISVAVEILDDLQYCVTSKSFQCFCL